MRAMELDPTWGLAFRVWWAMTWRMVLLSVVFSMAVGFVIGVIGAVLHLDRDSVKVFSGGAGLLVGLFVIMAVIHRMMNKGFGKYRLAVMVE